MNFFLFFIVCFLLVIVESVRGISFRYQHNDDEYSSQSYGSSLQPKLLSQSVHLKELPVQTVRITKTVAFKIPVPYPVPYPVQIPVYVKSPQILKEQSYISTHPHLNPTTYHQDQKDKNNYNDQHGQYDFSQAHWSTAEKNNFNDHADDFNLQAPNLSTHSPPQ